MAKIKRTPEDWAEIAEGIIAAIKAGKIPPTIRAASDWLGINYRTLQGGIKTAGYTVDGLVEGAPPRPGKKFEAPPAPDWEEDPGPGKFESKEEGNEATF